MRLFSNSCFGGWVYQMNNIPYSTPFIWAEATIPDMLRLMNNLDSINFNRFTIEPNDDWSLWKSVIDNQVTLYWTHYKFSATDKEPRKYAPADVYYCRIWEYIADKYRSRVARMCQDTSDAVFLLDFTKREYCPSPTYFKDIPSLYKCVVIHPYDDIPMYNTAQPNVLYLHAEWYVLKKPFLQLHFDEIQQHLLQ